MGEIGRLVYVANARLPTEKAHGYQIVKMCEAFARYGLNVVLMHPHRHQTDPALKTRTLFEYYGVKTAFKIRKLGNFDIVLLERIFPERIFPLIFFAHALLWGLYAALVAWRERADLNYTRDSQVAFWLVLLGLPTVYEAHAVPRRAQRWLLRRIAKNSALKLTVVLTSFIKERLVEIGFPGAQVIVSPDAVDLSHFKDLPSQAECRRRLGLPEGRPIIGYIGRFRTLEMEKGIPELVRAMAHVPSLNGADPLLLCVGGPMDVVPHYIDIAGRCRVPAHRLQFVDRVNNSDVPLWIRASDLVTIPWPWAEFSAYFTSPLKLFEYMAAGVPIVATDLPSIREVLRHGENAWLVEPGDPECLAKGIRALMADRDLAERLLHQARCDVRAYTWKKRATYILRSMPMKPVLVRASVRGMK